MNKHKWFWLVVALQLVFLVGMISMRQATLVYGTPILLKTEPIDPRSLFSGDYVILNYDISSLDMQKLKLQAQDFKRNDTVWVELQQKDKYWVAKRVAQARGKAQPGVVWLRGTVVYEPWDNHLPIKYGIETFFVPEGQGHVLEQDLAKVDVEVKVDRFGTGAVNRVFLEGEEVQFE